MSIESPSFSAHVVGPLERLKQKAILTTVALCIGMGSVGNVLASTMAPSANLISPPAAQLIVSKAQQPRANLSITTQKAHEGMAAILGNAIHSHKVRTEFANKSEPVPQEVGRALNNAKREQKNQTKELFTKSGEQIQEKLMDLGLLHGPHAEFFVQVKDAHPDAPTAAKDAIKGLDMQFDMGGNYVLIKVDPLTSVNTLLSKDNPSEFYKAVGQMIDYDSQGVFELLIIHELAHGQHKEAGFFGHPSLTKDQNAQMVSALKSSMDLASKLNPTSKREHFIDSYLGMSMENHADINGTLMYLKAHDFSAQSVQTVRNVELMRRDASHKETQARGHKDFHYIDGYATWSGIEYVLNNQALFKNIPNDKINEASLLIGSTMVYGAIQQSKSISFSDSMAREISAPVLAFAQNNPVSWKSAMSDLSSKLESMQRAPTISSDTPSALTGSEGMVKIGLTENFGSKLGKFRKVKANSIPEVKVKVSEPVFK